MRAVVLALILSAIADGVCAQPATESRQSVSLIGGLGKTYDDEGSLGRGWLVGGAIDRVVFGRTRLEGSLELLTHDRDAGYFLSNGRTVIGGLSLVRRFGSGGTQPYLFAGLTAGHHSGANGSAAIVCRFRTPEPACDSASAWRCAPARGTRFGRRSG